MLKRFLPKCPARFARLDQLRAAKPPEAVRRKETRQITNQERVSDFTKSDRALRVLAAILAIALAACSPEADANPDVFITKDGNVLWNGEPITCTELNARFRAGSEIKTEYPCDIFGRVSVEQ